MRPTSRPVPASWGWWLLAAAGPALALVLVAPPWASWGRAAHPVYVACVLGAHLLTALACVVGRLRNRSAGRRAWTAAAVALCGVTVLVTMESLLPVVALSSGASGVVYAVASGVVALSALAVPVLLVRARLNRTRDREGLIDAVAIATAVGLVLWDAMVLSGAVQGIDTVATMLTAAVATAATALAARLSFTGVHREPSAILLLAAGGLMLTAALLYVLATATGSLSLLWVHHISQVLGMGAAAAAALHPSAERLSAPVPDPGRLGARLSVGRLVALAIALTTPAGAAVARAVWRPTVSGAPPSLLPSAIAGLVVTASVVWRMTHLVRDREEARELLERRTLEDELTGLPNRRGLYEVLARRARATWSADDAAPFALQFIDLDGFKAINDTLGHAVGDMVLTEVADRIRAALRAGDTVARLAGDEFVTVCEGPIDLDLARRLAERIHDHVAAPIAVVGVEVAVSASIGVALPPPVPGDGGHDIEGLIHLADHAMYVAKRAGGSATNVAPVEAEAS